MWAFAAVCLCLVPFVHGQDLHMPNGHDLKMYTDMAFRKFDHTPVDGIVDEMEWDIVIVKDDVNNDTCVTFSEYSTAHQNMWPNTVSVTLFDHYDHDNDGCLRTNDMSDEFHLIDHNGNNQVDMHEWEQYFTHLSKTLFGHGADHGHHSG